MAVVENYSTAQFNYIPFLDKALQKHEEAGGNDLVYALLGPVFRKHGVDNMLGISLIHRHFYLEAGEYLTDVGGTSTPWRTQTGARPNVWAFDSTNLHLKPLEFAMDDDDSHVAYPEWGSDAMSAFPHDLAKVINRYRLNGIYGLVRYPGDGFKGCVEMTVERANVNLTPAQRRVNMLGKADKHVPAYKSETAWYFTEDFMKRGCASNCYFHGSTESGPLHNPDISA